jgi:hypothetical protein
LCLWTVSSIRSNIFFWRWILKELFIKHFVCINKLDDLFKNIGVFQFEVKFLLWHIINFLRV